MTQYLEHAVVMGGSIAGLLSAAALASYFDKVTVIERDVVEDEPKPRHGVPQGTQLHSLLSGGSKAIEALLPGFSSQLIKAGGIVGDMGEDVRFFHAGVWKKQSYTGQMLQFQTRPFLECHLRRRVGKLANVSLRFATAVEKPTYKNGRVTGVKISGGEIIKADLVVDATGRSSRLSQWLEEWEYGRTPKQTVELGLAYSSCLFFCPEEVPSAYGLIIYGLPPDHKRGGVLMRAENNLLCVTLQGYHQDHPPTDPELYLEFAKSLLQPDLYKIISNAQPLQKPKMHKFPRMLRRRFDQLNKLPDGLIPIGDSQASFDPVFGQGMTVAAQEALLLKQQLQAKVFSPKHYVKACARIIDIPWLITSVEASRWKTTTGATPAWCTFLHWYTNCIYKLSAHDAEFCKAFYQVMHMEKSLTSLFSPRLLMRVATAGSAKKV